MVDPSSPSPEAVFPEPSIPVFHIPTYHNKNQQPSSPIPVYVSGTPVVNELPASKKSDGMVMSPEYIQEPSLKNKRGSRRTSIRRDSHSHENPPIPSLSTTATAAINIPASQTLTSYALLRTKLQNELSSIPTSIRSDVQPTPEQVKILHHHILKLEDILDEVDAVATPTTDSEDILVTRKARREVVADIVGAIDGIERFITPDTPSEIAPTTEEDESEDESDGMNDEEIQRVIRETLARKKDDPVVGGSGRRSVTIEDVLDSEY